MVKENSKDRAEIKVKWKKRCWEKALREEAPCLHSPQHRIPYLEPGTIVDGEILNATTNNNNLTAKNCYHYEIPNPQIKREQTKVWMPRWRKSKIERRFSRGLKLGGETWFFFFGSDVAWRQDGGCCFSPTTSALLSILEHTPRESKKSHFKQDHPFTTL